MTGLIYLWMIVKLQFVIQDVVAYYFKQAIMNVDLRMILLKRW